MRRRVIAGVEESLAGLTALTWAVDEARRGNDELLVWRIDPSGRAASHPDPTLVTDVLAGGAPVVWHEARGSVADLRAACREADLLVLGARDGARPTATLHGSVLGECLSDGPCPVVVVRPSMLARPSRGRVLVGVDMSGHSRTALRVAADEARRRGVTLHAVHAVHWTSTGEELIRPSRSDLVAWGRRLLAREIAAAGVSARAVVVPGRADEVLRRRSRNADLLVVGSRGRGAVAGMLLGSTSRRCVRLADCPVMVVSRAAHDPAEGEPFEVQPPMAVAGAAT